MTQAEFLKKNYPTLVQQTVNRSPENYEEIRFDKFIEIVFPNSKSFISFEIILEIRTFLNQKYGNHSQCIKEFGVLLNVNLQELKFYQPTVGINGSMHTKIDEPVYVINHNSKMILYNGYHRILFQMLNGHLTIDAYVLAMASN